MAPPVDLSGDPSGQTSVMIAGCCVAIGALVPVAMYQKGMIGHVADPPSDIFNSDLVTSSAEAHPLGVPDALLGLASFGMTLALVAGARRSATVRRFLAAKLMMDTTVAIFNVTRQVVSFRRLCSWCTVAALAAAVTGYGGRAVVKAFAKEVLTGVESEG